MPYLKADAGGSRQDLFLTNQEFNRTPFKNLTKILSHLNYPLEAAVDRLQTITTSQFRQMHIVKQKSSLKFLMGSGSFWLQVPFNGRVLPSCGHLGYSSTILQKLR